MVTHAELMSNADILSTLAICAALFCLAVFMVARCVMRENKKARDEGKSEASILDIINVTIMEPPPAHSKRKGGTMEWLWEVLKYGFWCALFGLFLLRGCFQLH